jgi:dTDP-4-amino-4,6-dideoxygalactose transaminase
MTLSTWERHKIGPMEYDTVVPGWNYRPTELQAALGLTQLAKLDRIRQQRSQAVRRYVESLADMKEVTVPLACAQTWHEPACHLMPILLPDRPTRIRVREALQAEGVQTSHHYPPIHHFAYYRSHVPTARVRLPQTEAYADRELTLPLYPNLTDEQIDFIVGVIRKAL